MRSLIRAQLKRRRQHIARKDRRFNATLTDGRRIPLSADHVWWNAIGLERLPKFAGKAEK